MSDATPPAVETTPVAPRSHPWTLLALFVVLAALYLALHGRQYDGDAVKNSVWNRSGPHIAAVNHPFPGVWFWAWWQIGSGFVANDFDARMAWIEFLNGLLGAAAATLAAATLIAVGIRRGTALMAALLLALSHAWFYHSTQATEPMMAQFWFMLSLRCAVAIPRQGIRAVVASAIAWAVSVGAYQSYILGGVGLLWMVARERRNILPWLAASAVVGTSLYAGAAVASGARDVHGVIVFLTTKPDGEYWGFIRPSTLLQLPFGLANVLTPPWPVTRDWPGLRLGWAGLAAPEKALTSVIVVLACGLTAAVMLLRVPETQRRLKQGLLLVFWGGLFAPFYLLPYYNKLWLLPFGALGLAAALVADSRPRGGVVLAAVLALMMIRNGQQTYFQRNQLDNPVRRSALALEETLADHDLLVSDGWDASNLYNVRQPGRNVFRLIYQPVSAEKLSARMEETRRAGGKVFVFGLLELTREQFDFSDVAKRGKQGWYPVIQNYKPKSRLVWRGQDHRAPGDLYEILE